MTQTPLSTESSPQSFASVANLSDFQTTPIPATKPVKLTQSSLRNRLLSIILPTVFGSLAFSSLIGYVYLHEKAEDQTKLQLENQTILAGNTALLPENSFDILADNLSRTTVKKSQIIQIINLETNSIIQTITSQGASKEQKIIGGVEILKAVNLIQDKQQDTEFIQSQLKQEKLFAEIDTKIIALPEKQLIISFVAQKRYYSIFPIPNSELVAVTSIDSQELESSGKELTPILLNSLLVGTALTVIIWLISRHISNPLVNLATTAEQAAAGNLDILAQPRGTIETQTLANSFNNLIFQVKQLLQQQQTEAELARVLTEITCKINQQLDTNSILTTIAKKIRLALQVERIVYSQLEPNGQGKIIAESLNKNCDSILATPTVVTDNFSQAHLGTIQVIPQIETAQLSQSQRQQLQSWSVKASIIAPVFIDNQLDGLLMIHQCSTPRQWQSKEIDFVIQVANQMGFAFARLNLLQKQQLAETEAKKAQQQLQQHSLTLLREIEGFKGGDLTLRATVGADAIGTIAEAYNSTIGNLQQIVTQVKAAVLEVEEHTEDNQQAISKLAQEAKRQTNEIDQALQQIRVMNESIQVIATDASAAEEIVKQTGSTIEAGENTMNQTVAEINSIQETVAVAAEKIKRLGNSSQEISQAVNLIARFAAQTHLLALKASIEAARAGEQGKGFAVIADEVRSLATQSSGASAEIETLVAKIQQETQEVVEVMAIGTEQVKSGNELVKQTRQSLNQVTNASLQIQQLINAIAVSATHQTQTSTLVNQTVADVAEIAEHNSQSATQLFTSMHKLHQLAEQLNADLSKFKT